MAKTQKDYSIFPSQAVSDSKKRSSEYGLEVAKAIEQEWFNKDRGQGKYHQTRDNFIDLDCTLEVNNLLENIKTSLQSTVTYLILT